MTLRQQAALEPAPGKSKGPLPLGPLLIAGAVGLVLIVLAVWAFAVADRYALLAAALAGPLFAIILYRRSLEASRLALTDELTGLANDRRFAERLERDLERAEVEGKTVALCLLDVDDFKRINDGFGHAAGDRVLTGVAGLLRHGGEAFRLRGDEFALLLYGRDERTALLIAESVLRRVAEVEYGHGADVTVSIGLAIYPTHETERTELVRAADNALYRAKAAGEESSARVQTRARVDSGAATSRCGDTARRAAPGGSRSRAGRARPGHAMWRRSARSPTSPAGSRFAWACSPSRSS